MAASSQAPANVTECLEFLKVVAATPLTELAVLWQATSTEKDAKPEITAIKLRGIAARWHDLDSAGLPLAAKENPALALVWAKLQPAEVLAWTQAGNPGAGNVSARLTAASALVETDPKQALAVFASFAKNPPKESSGLISIAVKRAIELLAAKDRGDAMAQTMLLPKEIGRTSAFWALAGAWLKDGPAAAAQWAEGLVEKKDRKDAIQALIYAMGKSGAIAPAIELFKKNETGDFADENNTVGYLAKALAPSDLKKAVAFILDAKLTDSSKMGHIEGVMALCYPNPSLTNIVHAFGDERLNDTDGPLKRDSVTAIYNSLQRWQPADLSGAIQEAMVLPDSNLRHFALNYLGTLFGKNGQELTAETLRQFPVATQTILINSTLTKIVEEGSIDQFMKTVTLLEDNQARLTQIGRQGVVFAEQHPGRAREFLAQCPENARESIADGMVDNLAEVNPMAALDIASTRPPKEQGQLIFDTIFKWGQHDSYKASEYIKALPAGEMRDNAVAGLVQAINEDDPVSAAAWALDIKNPEGRVCQLADVFSTWRYRDEHKAKADAAFDALQISAAERKAVLKRMADK